MMVADGVQKKVEEGKKIAYNTVQTLRMLAWRAEARFQSQDAEEI